MFLINISRGVSVVPDGHPPGKRPAVLTGEETAEYYFTGVMAYVESSGMNYKPDLSTGNNIFNRRHDLL